MYVYVGLFAQKRQIVGDAVVVLSSTDPPGDVRVERLDADLELEPPRGKLTDEVAQLFGEAVGDHLEMHERRFGALGQKEVEDSGRRVDPQIERAIDELELPYAAVVQPGHRVEETIDVEGAHAAIERR